MEKPSERRNPLTPPPSVKQKGPLRVGGHVRAPKAIVIVQPEYPPLAREAHIQGQVRIDPVLDEQGSVVEMKVVSGPPLLYQAALNALKKWKHEPTYLNDQPIRRPDDCDDYLPAGTIATTSLDEGGGVIAIRFFGKGERASVQDVQAW